MWVFDDSRVGLVQEPLVAGTDKMIDRVVEDIPNAERGFTVIFSGGMEGWLCPALLRYFSEAPKQIYVQVKSREEGAH